MHCEEQVLEIMRIKDSVLFKSMHVRSRVLKGSVYVYIYVAETFRVYFTAGSSFSSSAIIIIF